MKELSNGPITGSAGQSWGGVKVDRACRHAIGGNAARLVGASNELIDQQACRVVRKPPLDRRGVLLMRGFHPHQPFDRIGFLIVIDDCVMRAAQQ